VQLSLALDFSGAYREPSSVIRRATRADLEEISVVINDAAFAYKDVIPNDRWHEPYMSMDELLNEVAAGIEFSCYVHAGRILGVMGLQDKGEVALIRHAYVQTAERRRGIGTHLLRDLLDNCQKPILIGTWKAATWATSFYERYGFCVVPDDEAQVLLKKYWNVPFSQMIASVVLAGARYYSSDEPNYESG
jgi:N-acetylglutamate synthase-like GNAT family acetyltransferase